MGVGKPLVNFVLGTLEAGKHNVNNVNNEQGLITVSIGEELSPGEGTHARHSTAQRSTQDLPQQIQRQRTIPAQNTNLMTSRHCSSPKQPTKKISPAARQESALQTRKHSTPQLQPTLGRNQRPRANQRLKQRTLMRSRSRRRRRECYDA